MKINTQFIHGIHDENNSELKKSYLNRIEKARTGPFIRVEGSLREYINHLQARDSTKNYKNTSQVKQKTKLDF